MELLLNLGAKIIFIMQLHLIQTGFFYCTGGAMFGVIPQKTWERKYPATREMCRLSMNHLVVGTQDRTVLVDTSIGLKFPQRSKSYGFENVVDIKAALIDIGIEPDKITDVILTHLHFDHCGGTTHIDKENKPQLTFPNARHWVSKSQWEHAKSPTLLDEDAYWPENYSPLENSGLLNLIESDTIINNEFRIEIYNGHTPGQLVPIFKRNNKIICFTGDVIPTAAHIVPLWISAYDLYPVDSVTEKIRLMQKASDENWILVTPHDAYLSDFTIQKSGNRFRIKDKTTLKRIK